MNPDWGQALASTAAAMGEPARARILAALLGGTAHTATELALAAGVGAPTASSHLQKLRRAGLVTVVAQGKHRYFRLAGDEVAALIEGLGQVAIPRALPAPRVPPRLCQARTCYDHIAGALGVQVHDRLLALGWIASPGYEIFPAGAAGLRTFGIDLEALQRARRRLAAACLDWSERRPHLGGAVGAALLETALRQRWLRRELEGRALEITPRGRREFLQRLGI